MINLYVSFVNISKFDVIFIKYRKYFLLFVCLRISIISHIGGERSLWVPLCNKRQRATTAFPSRRIRRLKWTSKPKVIQVEIKILYSLTHLDVIFANSQSWPERMNGSRSFLNKIIWLQFSEMSSVNNGDHKDFC